MSADSQYRNTASHSVSKCTCLCSRRRSRAASAGVAKAERPRSSTRVPRPVCHEVAANTFTSAGEHTRPVHEGNCAQQYVLTRPTRWRNSCGTSKGSARPCFVCVSALPRTTLWVSDGAVDLARCPVRVRTGRVVVFAERCRALGLILCFSVRRRAGGRLGVVGPFEVVQVSLYPSGYVLRVCNHRSGIRGPDRCGCRMTREDESR